MLISRAIVCGLFLIEVCPASAQEQTSTKTASEILLCEVNCPKLEYHGFHVDSVQGSGSSLRIELTDPTTGEKASLAPQQKDDVSFIKKPEY